LHSRLLWTAKDENETEHAGRNLNSNVPPPPLKVFELCLVKATAQRDHSTPNAEKKGTFLSSHCSNREMESPHEHQRATSMCSSATVPQGNDNSWGGGWKPPLPFLRSQENVIGVYPGGLVSGDKSNNKQV